MLGGALLLFLTLSHSSRVLIIFKRDLLPGYIIINLIIKPEMNPVKGNPSGFCIFYKYQPPEQPNQEKSHINVPVS